MKALRNMIALVAVAFLGLGYFASQASVLGGNVSKFAHQMDQTGIRILAALLLAGAIVMAFVPDREGA
jgi:hypothetical protein